MKSWIMGMAAIGCVAALAGPANAADVKTIGCIRANLAPDVAKKIGTEIQAASESDSATDDMIFEPLAAVAQVCQQRYHWSDAALDAALGYTITSLSLPAAEQALIADGLDPAVVTQVFRNMPADKRAAFAGDDVPDDVAMAFVQAAMDAGLAIESEAQGTHLGILAAMLAGQEAERARFAAQ